MQRVAVIGAGISGLSLCYFLKRIEPSLHVMLFEQDKVGGWMQTMEKQDFLFETGPRSIRMGPLSLDIFELAYEAGVLDKLLVSSTRAIDAAVYADGKVMKLFPPGYFRKIRGVLSTPLYRRLILARYLKKSPKLEPVDDESVADFVGKYIKFWNEEDKEYLISTFVDAFQLGIYSGDVHKLSARFCPPFADMFTKAYYPDKSAPSKRVEHENKTIETAFGLSLVSRANCFNFKGGLSILTNALLERLKKYPNFEYIPKGIVSIEKSDNIGKIKDKDGTDYKAEHVVSTIPSAALAKMLRGFPKINDLCNSIPHNSLLALNVGFENDVGLKGVGYLVPSREKSPISGVLYDSSQFPWLAPSVSIMGRVDKYSHEHTDIFVKEFQRQTGVKENPKTVVGSFCDKALPQYNVGHYKIVEELEKISPSWLHVSGQSIYRSGIPNCVITSKRLANKIMLKALT